MFPLSNPSLNETDAGADVLVGTAVFVVVTAGVRVAVAVGVLVDVAFCVGVFVGVDVGVLVPVGVAVGGGSSTVKSIVGGLRCPVATPFTSTS
jgi:hypothetical protein